MKRIDLECPACDQMLLDVYVAYNAPYPTCSCGTPMVWVPSAGAAVRPDDIPGGVLIHHGLCNADGSPKRYYSRSEINLACAVKGFVPWTDVYTEDRTKDARVHADWLQSGEAKRAKQRRDESRRDGVRPR